MHPLNFIEKFSGILFDHDQRKLAQRSERVKSVDLHPTEPW